jgi:hypothetical protein
VIVRIATEDQYEVSKDDYEHINELDNAVVAAVESGDEARYKEAFAVLIDFVKSHGNELGDDDLRQSDVIIPPSDTSLEEAEADFTGDGIIPESVVPD